MAAQILVIAKLNGRKYFILRGFVQFYFEVTEMAWNLFKTKNEDTRTMSLAFAGFILKRETLLKTKSGISCVIL